MPGVNLHVNKRICQCALGTIALRGVSKSLEAWSDSDREQVASGKKPWADLQNTTWSFIELNVTTRKIPEHLLVVEQLWGCFPFSSLGLTPYLDPTRTPKWSRRSPLPFWSSPTPPTSFPRYSRMRPGDLKNELNPLLPTCIPRLTISVGDWKCCAQWGQQWSCTT